MIEMQASVDDTNNGSSFLEALSLVPEALSVLVYARRFDVGVVFAGSNAAVV